MHESSKQDIEKSLPTHKDRYGEPCAGAARKIINQRGEVARLCTACGRIESYEKDIVVVVFKKGISMAEALRYMMQFIVPSHESRVASKTSKDTRQLRIVGRVEKDGYVALFVNIPLAYGKILETWIQEFEKNVEYKINPVLFASRVLRIEFES